MNEMPSGFGTKPLDASSTQKKNLPEISQKESSVNKISREKIGENLQFPKESKQEFSGSVRVMELGKKIIKGEMSTAENVKILTGIDKIFDQELSENAQKALLDIFVNIPDKDLIEFLDCTLKLSEGMNPNGRIALIRVLNELESNSRRIEVTKFAEKLIDQNMLLPQRRTIIQGLDKTLKFVKEKGALDWAANLINKEIKLVDVVKILNNIKSAQLIFKDGMDSSKLGLLEVLTDSLYRIETNSNIDKIVDCFKEFTSEDMSPIEIDTILRDIIDIPDLSMIDSAKEFLGNKASWNDLGAVILIAKKNPEILNTVLEASKKQPLEALNTTQKIATFLCLSSNKNLELVKKIQESSHTESTPQNKEIMEIEGEFDLPFVDMPTGSPFADTDLVILKDDFKGVMPLNGIKEKEFHQIEELYSDLITNKTPIKINGEKVFTNKVEDSFKILLTRGIGRSLITQILKHPSMKEVAIRQGDHFFCHGSLLVIDASLTDEKSLRLYEHLPSGKIESRRHATPFSILLGHEMFHYLHGLQNLGQHVGHQEPTLDKRYRNLEEQTTITGFTKDIQVPEKDSPSSQSERNLEYHQAKKEGTWKIDSDKKWVKEEGIFTKEVFDPMNERNLTAAFTDSDHVFYPRAFHDSENIYKKEWAAVKEDILNRFDKLSLSQDEIKLLKDQFLEIVK